MNRCAAEPLPRVTRDLLRRSWQSWLSNDLANEGPWWLMWLWTILFCTAIAAVFTVIGVMASARDDALASLPHWASWFARDWIVCMTIGAVIHLLFIAAARVVQPHRVRGWARWQRAVFFTGLPVLGLAIGWPLGVLLAGGDLVDWLATRSGARSVILSLAIGVLIIFVMNGFYAARERQADAERRATEAQLRLLQAQMEPHFLFNTLANLQALIDEDPARASLMLETFTDYLRSSLTQFRTGTGTLGDELALAETYLKLQQMRMADRLAYRIEADDEARAATLPPLVLQPLVENAIRHGLEPKIEGGTVTLRARTDGMRLTIEVADDGLGIDARPRRPGAGVALDNLRQRLRTIFDDRARVELLAGDPGTRAVLTLPFERRQPAAPSSLRAPPAASLRGTAP